MIETTELCMEEPGVSIRMLVTRTGGGVIVQLLGGDRPHIGATIITHPRPSLEGGGKTSCNSIVVPEIGHKEDELAKPLAERISTTLNCTVVLIAGIHINNAKPDLIERISKICHQLVDKFLSGC